MAEPQHRPGPVRWLALATTLAVAIIGTSPVSVAAEPLSPRELVPLLTRNGVAPDLTLLEAIYAPPFFFAATGLQQPPEMAAQPTLAFLLQESVHEGALPVEVPEAFLLMPDGERVAAYDARVTAEDEHHRVSRLLFAQPEAWPEAAQDENGEAVLRLIVPDDDGTFSVSNVFEWTVPIEIDGVGMPDQ